MNIVFFPASSATHCTVFFSVFFMCLFLLFCFFFFFYNTVPAILSQFFYQFFFEQNQLQCTELSINGTMPLHECTSPGFNFFSSNLNATINAAFLSTQQNHTQWIRSNARTPQCSWFVQLECTFGILLFLLPPTHVLMEKQLCFSQCSVLRGIMRLEKKAFTGGWKY